MPRVSASCVVSMIWTGKPALAKHMAMPPPIVPAPRTRRGRSARRLSPDVGDLRRPRARRRRNGSSPYLRRGRSSVKSAARSPALVERRRQGQFDGSRRRAAAPPAPRAPREVLAHARQRGPAGRAPRQASRRGRAPSDADPRRARAAKATAPASESPSTSASTTPIALAFAAGIGSPDRIISTAVSMTDSRGRRCVPPAPGIDPSLISGSPSRRFPARRGNCSRAPARTRRPSSSRGSPPRPASARLLAGDRVVKRGRPAACRTRGCRRRR